jgi:predicted phosphodiesterase
MATDPTDNLRTSTGDVPDEIDQIVIFGDVHGHLPPLEAFEREISGLEGATHLICNGDLIYGGIHPVEAIEWVMQHVGNWTTSGNHDEIGFQFGYDCEPQPPHTEVGALQRLSDTQRNFLRSLPHRLVISWRNRRIVCMHGHRSRDDRSCSWLSDPTTQTANFLEEDADLCAASHTHFAYRKDSGGRIMVNPGSIASPILGVEGANGIHIQSGETEIEAGDNLRSSFVIIREKNGRLEPEIRRFDYDRQLIIDEMFATEHGAAEIHRGWLLDGVIRM